MLQGVDPDAPEDDEDNEVDDADGDQEETELLWVTTHPQCFLLRVTIHPNVSIEE